MTTRAFSDRQGEGWKVWKTVPQDGRGCLPGFEKGWLTFEHERTEERRRLVPIPDGWESAGEDRLLLWCRVAEPVRVPGSRTSPPGGMPALPDEDAHSPAGVGD